MQPLPDNLRFVQFRNDNGDLVPLLDHAGGELQRLVQRVMESGKSGKLTLTIDVKSSNAGALAVKGKVALTLPKPAEAESLLWGSPEGNLLTDNPAQKKLQFQEVKEPSISDVRKPDESKPSELRTA